MKKIKNQILPALLLTVIITLMTGCVAVSHPMNQTMEAYSAGPDRLSVWEGSTKRIWNKLLHHSQAQLLALNSQENDQQKKAWINLALDSKQNSVDTVKLARKLIDFRGTYPDHPANQLIPSDKTLNALILAPSPHHIAILLPEKGQYGFAGRTIREGFLNAYYANPAKIDKQKIKFYDYSQTDIKEIYQQALREGADLIVGPLEKEQVKILRSVSHPQPMLALNYADLSFGNRSSQFYEFGLLPEDEVIQIADKALAAGLSKALIIAPQNAWGKRLVQVLQTHWQSNQGQIQDTWYFGNPATFNHDIAALLKPKVDENKNASQEEEEILVSKRREDFDVIFLFAQPEAGRAIVPLLKYYYASNIPIYSTAAIYSGKPNPSKDVDLDGVTLCDIPWKTGLTSPAQKNRLYAVGQDAYLLSQSLLRLQSLPDFPLYGATGALTLVRGQQIYRHLPCMTIHNGHI